MLELIILGFSVLTNFVLAILIFAKNPQKNVNKYFSFFAITLIGWSITNYISVHPVLLDQLFWIRLDMAWAVFLSMSLLLLVNVFPTDIRFYPKIEKPAILIGILITIGAMTPWLFTDVDYSSGQPQPVPGPLILPFAVYALGALGLSIYILVRRLHMLTERAREYVRYAIIGLGVTFSLLIFFNFIMVVIFYNSAFIVFTPAIILIFSISFVYGMIRRKLFDIRLIVARFVAYLLLLIFASLLYGFMVVVVSFFVTGMQPTFSQVIPSTIVVGIMVLLAQPLRKLFNRWTRAIFYQDDYNTKDVLDGLASVLVRSADTGTLTRRSMTVLQNALKSRYITFLLIDESSSDGWRRISTGSGGPQVVSTSLADMLAELPDVTIIENIEGQDEKTYKRMKRLNVSVVARLETQSGVIGYSLFGYKTSGTSYSQRDVDLIRIARDEMAVAIQNALRFDEIQDLNATLQQRIEEATKELRHSNIQLQKLDAAKDEFVSMASHQLRTPLTSIKGYLSMVLEGDVGTISDQQRKMLSEAYTSSERMVHLIGDFLNVSRLQTGKFIVEGKPVDLVKMVSQEVDSLRTTVEAHDLHISFHTPPYFPILNIDEAKVRQVIINYIDNAIFYSHEGTTIKVRLYVDGGDAVFEVQDTGIGVPKKEQARLFSKFFRATNARKQRPDGTGVGLFLSKKVIDSHNGTVIFNSVEGEGSTFGFRLPIKKLSVPHEETDKLGK